MKKKNILVINYYPFSASPSTGGEIRLFEVYSNLARQNKDFNITFLSPMYIEPGKRKVGKVLPNLESVEYSKGYNATKNLPNIISKIEGNVDPHGINSIISSKYDSGTVSEILEHYENSDVIIHEHPYERYSDILLGHDDKPRIYASHNVEANMFDTFSSNSLFSSMIRECEDSLAELSDKVFAVSEADVDYFYEINKEAFAVANGFPSAFCKKAIDRRLSQKTDKLIAMFIGSSHTPNIDAANYIISEIAPRLPQVEFHICGKVCEYVDWDNSFSGNIRMRGFITDREKHDLFSTAAVFLNPIESGGGSNIKLIEAAASGARVVTTPFGARGYDLTEEGIIYAAEKENFPEKIVEAIESTKYSSNFNNWFSEIYEKYSWHSVSKIYARHIRDLL